VKIAAASDPRLAFINKRLLNKTAMVCIRNDFGKQQV
jgi:hypothetical protein